MKRAGFEIRVKILPTMHLFDQAVALSPLTALGDDHFSGATNPAWGNFVGPFGGISAAVLLNAVMQHKALLGEPISQTVNYCSPIADGAFEIQAVPARTNRSTQHWMLTMTQQGLVVMTGSVVTAARRTTWSAQDVSMPAVQAPTAFALSARKVPMRWLERYEMRLIQGAIPDTFDGQESGSITQLWVKNSEPRAVDLPALAAFCDVFFPRLLLRRASFVPFGTVSMTSYFHTDSTQLADCGGADQHLLGHAQAQAYRNGFFDQTAQVWSESGVLLATTHQVVYFKE
jgi:acyl-CoA thioesterase